MDAGGARYTERDPQTDRSDRVWSVPQSSQVAADWLAASITTNEHSSTSPVGLCCSPGGLADVARVLFQNVECHKRLGPPRPLGEYRAIMDNLTEAQRQARRGWLLKVVQVFTSCDLIGLPGHKGRLTPPLVALLSGPRGAPVMDRHQQPVATNISGYFKQLSEALRQN